MQRWRHECPLSARFPTAPQATKRPGERAGERPVFRFRHGVRRARRYRTTRRDRRAASRARLPRCRGRRRTPGTRRPDIQPGIALELDPPAGPAPSRHSPAPERPGRAAAAGDRLQDVHAGRQRHARHHRQLPSVDQSSVCSTKPRPLSDGPPSSSGCAAAGAPVPPPAGAAGRRSTMPGSGRLTTIPIAPSAEWAQRHTTEWSKRGSCRPGMAISRCPVR